MSMLKCDSCGELKMRDTLKQHISKKGNEMIVCAKFCAQRNCCWSEQEAIEWEMQKRQAPASSEPIMKLDEITKKFAAFMTQSTTEALTDAWKSGYVAGYEAATRSRPRDEAPRSRSSRPSQRSRGSSRR
jgi:hypothetical protein